MRSNPPSVARVAVLAVLCCGVAGAGEGASAATWRGDGSGRFDAGCELIADPAAARVVWTSGFRAIPPGWRRTTGRRESGIVGGYGGPVVAGDAVLIAWYAPSGEVVDEETRVAQPDRNPEKWRVAADDHLLCIDGVDGTTRWHAVSRGTGLNHNFRRQGPLMHPVVARGGIYLLGSGGRLHRFAAEGGDLVWSVPIGEAAARCAALVAQGTVFRGREAQGFSSNPAVAAGVVAVNDHAGLFGSELSGVGGMAGFDSATGELLWRVAECLGASVSPVVAFDGDESFFVAACSRRTVAVAPADGTILWEIEGRRHVRATPAVCRGRLFLGGSLAIPGKEPVGDNLPASCYRITARDATRIWELGNDFTMAWASPACSTDALLVVADRRLHRLDPDTGRARAAADYDGAASPILADGLVVAGNRLWRAVDLAPLGELRVLHEAHTTAAYADGRIYLRGPATAEEPDSGAVHCVDLRTEVDPSEPSEQ